MSDHNDSEDEGSMAHDESNWLVSYADMMTLLFGFFVLMYSLSRLDSNKYVVVSKDIAKYFGGHVKHGSLSGQKIEMEKLNEVLLSLGLVSGQSKDFQIQAGDENSILLKLKDAVLFAPGSDQLSEASKEMLEKVEDTLANFKDLSSVNIEGHTDDNPISSVRFPSNWELSSARSARIVRLFFEKGLKKPQMVSEGYADSRPLVPNRDDEGTAIPENQSLNRRVVIRLKFENPEGKNDNAKEVLNKLGAELIVGKPKSASGDVNKIGSSDQDSSLDANADLDARFQEAQARLEEARKKLRITDEEKRKKQKLEELEKKIKDVESKIQQSSPGTTGEKSPVPAPKKQEGSK